MYKRKTEDEFDILGDYGQGPEMVTCETSYSAAMEQIRTYRKNEPGIKFTYKKHRVKKAVAA
jgi:hypothetical protein